MALTPRPAEAGASLIEGLPTELLEKIFLYTVNDITPPKPDSSDRDKVTRLQTELETGVSLAVQALRFRLVCRRFRDASWRAFGKTVEVTTFDLRSRRSMLNFQAIAERPKLSPWIKVVTFTCNISEELWPYTLVDDTTHGLTASSSECQLVQDDALWFPDLWSNFNLDSRFKIDDLALKPLIQIVARCLSQLSNVEGISYFWDILMPAQRFKSTLAGHRLELFMMEDFEMGREAHGAHLGLYIIFEALADAGIQPRTLDLAVELCDRNAFIVDVTKALHGVLHKVETLTLRDKYYPICNEQGQHHAGPRVCITKDLFPMLKSLAIDYHGWSLLDLVSFPSESEIPDLSNITIIDGYADEDSVGDFLAQYGRDIQNLSIVSSRPEDLTSIVESVDGLQVEVLNLRQGSDEDWEGRFEEDLLDQGITEELASRLKVVAKKVVLEPPKFERCVDMMTRLDSRIPLAHAKRQAI